MVVDLESLSNVKTDVVIKFILENISDLVEITNDKFEIEIINDDAHKTITGYDDIDLTGKSLLETIHPKDRKRANGELRKLLKNGIFEGKTRLKCKNGEYIWVKIDGQTFYDTLGNKKIILVGKEFFKHRYFAKSYSTNEDKFKEMLDNLTEIRFWKMLQPKQAVAIYQESQEMLKLIMDNIPQYIAWKDKNLTYLGCNNNFLDLFNIENEEDLLGKKDFDLMWGEEYALSLYMNDSRVLESNAPEIHMVELWQNQEGVKMWFDINRIPLHDLEGNVVGILITLDNITDRNFAEQQLKESEEMFRTIGEQSLMGIGILQNEVFKYVNKQFAKIYGYNVDDLLSWPELEYQKLTHPDDLSFAADQARKKQLGEKDVINRYQFRGVKKSGEIIWLEIFSKSISYEGYPADLVAIIDVSEKKLAVQKLEDSEAKFRHLVSSSPAIIYTTDVSDDYGATFMSENLKVLTGYSPEEFTSDLKFWFNHIHPDDKERIKTGLAELFVKNHHYHEYRFKFKDGTYHWMRDEVNLIKDENGVPIETIGYWSDITEQKIAERKLRESEENYRLITENVNDLISVLNKNVRYEYINEQAHFEILGYKKEDLLGKSIVSYVHPDDREIGIEMLRKGKKAGKDKGVFRVKHKDGHYLWVEVKGKIFFDNDNELKVIMISRDITERKKAEDKLKILNKDLEVKVEERTKELKLSKEKYQLITENVNDSIAVVDDDFNYEYLNKIFEETFGYSSSEFIGKNRLELLHPEDMQIGLDGMKELLDKGESTLEVRVRKKDGNYLWLEINGKIFYDNFNQRKALLVGRDITERKKTEQRLRESEEKYRLLFANSPNAIILSDEKGNIVDCNTATEDIFGISRKNLTGQNYMKTQDASLAYIFKDRYDQLLEQLTEVIHIFYDMAINYPDTFTKYFSDFVNFIKLLIVSNRTHKIIGADFSIVSFIRYLMNEKGINFFLTEKTHKRWIQNIINFLKNSKYSSLFPAQMQSSDSKTTHRTRPTIIGSRIKLYVMKHIYDGKYFVNGIAVCPDCLKEGLIVNTCFPRIRSKEFHHGDIKIQGYSGPELFKLFNRDRGNPYFLFDLIKKMESEQVSLKCSVHHHITHSNYFIDFRKFINWEYIPKEFPQDIFSIPPEIIHILSMICIDNFHKTKLKNTNQKAKIRISELIYNIKKRYIIDIIYDGICPACKEISIKDHLSSFDFNHLFELIKTSLKNGEKVERKKIKDLAHLPCSGIVKKLVEEQGGFVCRNCHRVIHNNIQFVNLIYDKENTRNLVIEDYNKTILNFEQNLISYDCSFEDPLETEFNINRSIIDYLFVFFDILKVKKVVTTQDLMDKMNRSRTTISSFFVKHKDFLSKYGKIMRSKTTEYYLNEEGKKFVRLMIYFRDYYNNLI